MERVLREREVERARLATERLVRAVLFMLLSFLARFGRVDACGGAKGDELLA